MNCCPVHLCTTVLEGAIVTSLGGPKKRTSQGTPQELSFFPKKVDQRCSKTVQIYKSYICFVFCLSYHTLASQNKAKTKKEQTPPHPLQYKLLEKQCQDF